MKEMSKALDSTLAILIGAAKLEVELRMEIKKGASNLDALQNSLANQISKQMTMIDAIRDMVLAKVDDNDEDNGIMEDMDGSPLVEKKKKDPKEKDSKSLNIKVEDPTLETVEVPVGNSQLLEEFLAFFAGHQNPQLRTKRQRFQIYGKTLILYGPPGKNFLSSIFLIFYEHCKCRFLC